MLQKLLEAEMEEAPGTVTGERTPERLGYRSGYYGDHSGPQAGAQRATGSARPFLVELFERYQRSERALAEMYVRGSRPAMTCH